ncbi:MAG: hypothetical protein IT317_24440 [Anaerolineales bacterium]|nr:hypothetical protein [Anaerolineales bacterium]
MTESASGDVRRGRVPAAFDQHNREKFERVVRLTQQAIIRLETQGRPITLAALAEATRGVDDQGKGITPATILRNPAARELFHQHSLAYKERQRTARQAKRKGARPTVAREAQVPYRGLRACDLIPMIETLTAKLVALQAQHDKLKTERDEAYRLREEAVQQIARQLAALTGSRAPASPSPHSVSER